MRQVLGSELRPEVQEQAKRMFVHRSTKDYRGCSWYASEKYPIQFASDADWLAHSLFWVRDDGQISAKYRFCESTPTWPDNPELRMVTP